MACLPRLLVFPLVGNLHQPRSKRCADVFTPFDRVRLKLLFADQFQA